MFRLGQATSWRGRGGRLGLRQTYVTNLQEHHQINTITMANMTSTLLAQWLGQPGGLHEVVSSSPDPSTFFFYAHKDLYLYIQCMYIVCTLDKLVCTWYRHVHHFECSLHCSPRFIIVHLCLYTVCNRLYSAVLASNNAIVQEFVL